MPLDWSDYNGFDWANAKQSPMTEEQRAGNEAVAAGLLAVPAEERQRLWGAASPPGRFAATVVHVCPGVSHRYAAQAGARGVVEIGVKLFKTNRDAQNEAQRVLRFYVSHFPRLPGLPNDHVQKTLDAGIVSDAQGAQRAYLVQEWVPGETLEELLRRRWVSEPVDGARVRSILEQLFGQIIVPLWGEGTVWWDARDANYCWHEAAGRLTMIDADSLAAYADEIVETPHVWERRDKGQSVALARLRQMTLRLLRAQALSGKKGLNAGLEAAWREELEPALRALGRDPARKEERKAEALAALRGFMQRLEEAGFLG